MNIKHTELADALVLTTSDIKIICCAGCCVRGKMLRCGKERGSSTNTFKLSVSLRNLSRKRFRFKSEFAHQ